MANGGGTRSLAATLVGWLLVAVVAYLLFGFVIGTLRWLFRLAVIVVVVGGLAALYVRLKE